MSAGGDLAATKLPAHLTDRSDAPNRALALVTLVVPDYAEALQFYRDVLGFETVEDRPLGGGKRWVVVRPGALGAALLLAKAASPQQRATIGAQTGGRVALFLQTDDFARDHARYLEAGVVFEEAPREESYGWVAVFRDPFGNRWDLIEPRWARRKPKFDAVAWRGRPGRKAP